MLNILDPGSRGQKGTRSRIRIRDTVFVGKLTSCVLICLIYFVGRTIVLYNPDAKGLTQAARVEQLRERVYATLEEYTRYLDTSFTIAGFRIRIGFSADPDPAF